VIPRPGAGDVQEVTFGFVDLLEVRIVTDALHALLKWDDLVVAGHHDHGPEFETLGQVHGADRDVASGGFDVFVEDAEGETRTAHCGLSPSQLRGGTDEDAELVRQDPGLGSFGNPGAHGLGFLVRGGQLPEDGWRTIEGRDGVVPGLGVAVDVGHFGAQEAIGLLADLMRGAVVDARCGS
jgi:hypothetical protein